MKRPRYEIPVDKSQCKCLADVVLLYLRYGCSKLNYIADSRSFTNAHDNTFKRPDKDTEDQQRLKKFQECAEYLYKELVRGDIVGNPRVKAAGILYVAAVMTQVYVSQQDIAELFGIAETSLRNSYVQIKEKGKKQGLWT